MKKNNISQESVQLMKEFKKKQISNNIRLHIIFLILILLINIGLVIFIIVYKRKIREIKSKTSDDSNSINSNKEIISKRNNEIEHKLINILALAYNGYKHFSFIFDTKEEVDFVKNSLIEYYREKDVKIDKNKIYMVFQYQGMIDGDSYSEFKEKINYIANTFIVLKTEKEQKFGFYFGGFISIEENETYAFRDQDCFLISLQKEGLFKCIGNQKKIEIKNDNERMLNIGDGDIIIKSNFLEMDKKRGIINYPFKSFDISTINTNIFTGENGEFAINGLEIYSLYFELE